MSLSDIVPSSALYVLCYRCKSGTNFALKANKTKKSIDHLSSSEIFHLIALSVKSDMMWLIINCRWKQRHFWEN